MNGLFIMNNRGGQTENNNNKIKKDYYCLIKLLPTISI